MARIKLSGIQIPTLSKLNIDGELTLDADSGVINQILVSQGAGNTPAWTNTLNLLNPLLTSVSTVGGSGNEGGQINFARVTDGAQYWYIDSFGASATPSLRFVENTTTQVQIDTGGVVTLSGALKLRVGTATANTAPLYLAAGTNLTTPVYGAVEAATNNIYVTNNPGSNTTGPGRGIVAAPQMVFSLAASSGANGSTPINIFAAANDVLSVLEPARLYRFRAKYFFNFTYAGGSMVPTIIFGFGNAPTAIKWSFKTWSQAGGTTFAGVGSSTSTASSSILSSNATASGSWVTEIDGYFTTHATSTSTLTPQASTPAGVSGPGFIFEAGSWFEVEKLGTSTQTLIAGNWA